MRIALIFRTFLHADVRACVCGECGLPLLNWRTNKAYGIICILLGIQYTNNILHNGGEIDICLCARARRWTSNRWAGAGLTGTIKPSRTPPPPPPTPFHSAAHPPSSFEHTRIKKTNIFTLFSLSCCRVLVDVGRYIYIRLDASSILYKYCSPASLLCVAYSQ